MRIHQDWSESIFIEVGDVHTWRGSETHQSRAGSLGQVTVHNAAVSKTRDWRNWERKLLLDHLPPHLLDYMVNGHQNQNQKPGCLTNFHHSPRRLGTSVVADVKREPEPLWYPSWPRMFSQYVAGLPWGGTFINIAGNGTGNVLRRGKACVKMLKGRVHEGWKSGSAGSLHRCHSVVIFKWSVIRVELSAKSQTDKGDVSWWMTERGGFVPLNILRYLCLFSSVQVNLHKESNVKCRWFLAPFRKPCRQIRASDTSWFICP